MNRRGPIALVLALAALAAIAAVSGVVKRDFAWGLAAALALGSVFLWFTGRDD
ncbi:MAG TPA: hypothetical protein VF771_09960 [Longimicrobiaceae bacterium]